MEMKIYFYQTLLKIKRKIVIFWIKILHQEIYHFSNPNYMKIIKNPNLIQHLYKNQALDLTLENNKDNNSKVWAKHLIIIDRQLIQEINENLFIQQIIMIIIIKILKIYKS